jgi:diguanylate cyclase (GGDEF)-like protein/PAS domain S-box-containing protein
MKSLGTRIALVLATVLFSLVLVAGLWIERQLSQAIHNEEVDQAKLHAQTLLASLRILMLNGQGTQARAWLDSMHGTAGIVDIEVLRRDGSEAFTDLDTVKQVNGYLDAPVFEREPVPSHHLSYSPGREFDRALEGDVALDQRFPGEITVLHPIAADTECLPCHGYDSSSLRGVLKLSLSREQGIARVDAMRRSLWVIAAIMVVVITAVVWVALRFSVLGPINRLRDAISRVGAGERHIKLPVHWRDELGQVAAVFGEMQDELLANEARIRAVTENAFDAIITADENGIIDSVNHAVEEMFGYSAVELLGKNVSMLMPEPYRTEHGRHLDRHLITGKGRLMNSRGELTGQRKDGTTFPIEISLSDMFIGAQRYFVAVARDITETKQQTAALEYQALHDGLTELPNRILLSDRVRQSVLMAQRNHQPFVLLIMDLDRFKEINDTLGHHYGDMVLQQVAQRVRNVLRESDTIARLGGDEFAVLLPNTDLLQAKNIIDKLLKSIEEPFLIGEQALHVGASIGVTLYPNHGEDEVTLMQRADVAMYVAKRNHSGYAVYDPATDQHSLRNLALLGELRGAIERDQLVLWYQPKINMASGRVYGVEALVRWQHPVHGLMYPDEFIPLAEQTGLITLLSMWVLKAGLAQCQQYRGDKLPLDMAVNLSVRNLHDPRFPEKVARLIAESCGEPRRLRLEITETAIMADPLRALETLNSLNAMGVLLSIDDFGTGYSSLAYLKQMPVDELKIDRSFVMGMLEDENDVVIVRSIIDLAHNIGIPVVAEGVENQETYDMLKNMGCDAVQGRFICGPLPVAELMQWIAESPWGVRAE